MRRLSFATVAIFLLAGLLLPASGYAQQSLNLYVGGFVGPSTGPRNPIVGPSSSGTCASARVIGEVSPVAE